MKLSGTKATAIHQYRGLGNQLWDLAGNRPSLDLRFADNKSLVDATTGTNLIDFTRASSGTYVGSDGLIKTATTNYLLRSEEFDQSPSPWSKDASLTVTANAAQAPNGTTTADLLDGTGSSNFIAQTVALVSGTTYTVSVWVKSAGLGKDTFRLFGDNNQFGGNQTATSTWTRFSYTFTAGATGSRNCFLTRDTSNNPLGIYIWGAQLEQSSTVGEYIPTTSTINSAPRFDHDPTTGESLGLLVEESRVNNVLQSESVTTSPWGTNGNPTFIVNNAISPAGNLTADLVVGNNSEVFAGPTQALSSLVIGNSYSVSLFVKPNTATTTRLGLLNPDTAVWNFYVDIAWTAGIPSTQSTFGSPTNVEYRSYGNGWYRCSLTGAVDTVTPRFMFQPDRTATAKSAWIWGASVESESAGASAVFPTSYIPTTDSTVTRADDVASISGNNFSSWYRQSGGSLFTHSARQANVPTGKFPVAGSLNDGTINNRINNSFITTSLAGLLVTDGGVTNVNLYPPVASLDRKFATAFTTDDFAASVNGDAALTDTSGAIPIVNQLRIGDMTGYNTLNGTIRRLVFWPARLPDSTLQGITQQ